MVEVRKSRCCCGKCKTEFKVAWDLEIVDVSEQGMGECIQYYSEIEAECPNCENVISAILNVSEYPIGVLEFAEIQEISDSEETDRSEVEVPLIAFFDL